jgi:hypothetical protein
LLTTSTARRIEITEEPIQTKHHYGALVLGGGVLEDSSVALDPGKNTTGVLLGDATSVSGPNVLVGPSSVRRSARASKSTP